jgi:hypothetical protein
MKPVMIIMWGFCIIWLILGIILKSPWYLGMVFGVLYASFCHWAAKSE